LHPSPRLALLVLALACANGAAGAGKPSVFGVWSNPSGHVHIRAARCGPHVCGTVVYASDKARADAARAGNPKLIGMNLFQQFAQTSEGEWHGKVLVPDLDRTVAGRIRLVDADTLDVEGCMFGHVACKDQTWKRVR
jgi:uncharacterized protein (DUF2147 family)